MTRARDLAVVAAALVWWSPMIALALVRAAPHIVAVRGRPCRIRRVHSLIDRGEAERVIAALRHEVGAVEYRRSVAQP